VARILTRSPGATPEDGAEWVAQLTKQLGIPPLRTYSIGVEHAADLAAKASRANSMKANPVALTPAELTAVLEHYL